MNGIDAISLEQLSNKERRKLKRLKKSVNEILLLSGKDPTEDCGTELQAESLNTANGEEKLAAYGAPYAANFPSHQQQGADEHDIAMKVSRKLQAIRQEVAPAPLIQFRLDGLRGSRLGSQHIAALAQRSVSSNVAKTRWLCIKPERNIIQTVVIRVDTTLECVENNKKDSFIEEFFGRKRFIRMQKEVANREDFWQSMLNIPIPRHEQIRQFIAQGADPLNSFVSQNLRGNLLISVEQMAHFGYPFPGSQVDDDDITSRGGVRATKSKYAAVQASSPLFAIDCEMCLTSGGQSELTRITMVDEQCNVVIDTLVKPHEEITDYVTKFSGITRKLLDPVQVRLEHVQRALSNILPEDAIIVGHSLEYDLRALKLSHPYCIDVSSILNLSGSEKQRSSLKTLTSIFLGQTIQDKKGHCSVEDAVATMRLVNLKLENGFQFGNVSQGWNFDVWARANGLTNTGARVGEKRQRAEGASERDNGSAGPPNKKHRSPGGKANSLDRCCSNCGGAKNVDCSVDECPCLTSTATVCVICSSMDDERESEQRGERLDWSAALGTSSVAGTRPLVEEVMAGKNKSMLCCANGESCSFESSPKTKFCDTRHLDSPADLLDKVCGQMLEHNLVMVELDSNFFSKSEDRPISSQIDNFVESLVSSASTKALIILILSSPQESTCRISVKP